jgi:histidinol-phosphatase
MTYGEQYGVLLQEIANQADALAMAYFRDPAMRVKRKEDGTALTPADCAIEEMARAMVKASGIALGVFGEEMGTGDGKVSASCDRARLIIDPIDGTEEFSRGIPTFGTLLGVERGGAIVAGMASAPALGARWWAFQGEGAYRNGERIHVSSTDQLNKAMVFTTGTGPSKGKKDQLRIRRLADAAKNARAMGGFWQHMLVAEGAIDAALDWTSKPWDLAPLGIIVEEAGGRSTNLKGERTIYTGAFVSTNGKLHDAVLQLLQ